MNWLDIFLLVIIGFFVFKGLKSGLLKGLAGLLGFILGLAVALNFYQFLADMINLKWQVLPFISSRLPFSQSFEGILNIICFIIIFFLVSWAVKMLGAVLGTMAKLLFLGPVDRIGGGLLGAVNGCFLATVTIGLLHSLQLPSSYIFQSPSGGFLSLALQNSTLTPFFTNILVILNVKFPGWGL